MTKFAPPTKMHLRNLITTYQQWIATAQKQIEEGVEFPDFSQSKAGKRLIFELRKQIRNGDFKNLPEGV